MGELADIEISIYLTQSRSPEAKTQEWADRERAAEEMVKAAEARKAMVGKVKAFVAWMEEEGAANRKRLAQMLHGKLEELKGELRGVAVGPAG